MNDLIKLLPQILLKAGAGGDGTAQAVFSAWAAASGRKISSVTAPIRLDKKALIVAVVDETWRAQLRAISGQLLFKINALLGSPVLNRLEFVRNDSAVHAAHPKVPTVTFIAPDQQAAYLADQAEGIASPSLKMAFLRAAGKCLDRIEDRIEDRREDRIEDRRE